MKQKFAGMFLFWEISDVWLHKVYISYKTLELDITQVFWQSVWDHKIWSNRHNNTEFL